ncbi:type I phosphomannose isomerase catalytic subunit [uncultured Winogradskyella sp.]|uniref:type I phosphomannose isomerase catalytic subunit n=1 Tax=uncultured Winogradskyella sp. TaxID=395353 RepID=UPI002627A312|nr:type I phosphomannose isomerase catalytic subunit [uncultured Winogradskyella sp.]|tara:strand:+ start:464 stop:1429 length:966 start_codon:yes stop_codon:yes gene_type:complete
MQAYPIKFAPILKEKIWGGEKLSEILNKKTDLKNVGESWEISGVEDNISTVANGLYKGKSLNDLIKLHKSEFLGKQNIDVFGENFPLLIKFLDAKTNLSVQVHPDDEMSKAKHNSFGKTEMWYIMNSDEDAEIVLGLKDNDIDKNVLSEINASNVDEIFNTEKVKQGDSYFIPAGKIHAIGAGVLAAEIQQTSDITYRVYDWDRTDAAGEQRELHTVSAIGATKSFPSNGKSNYQLEENKTSNLVDCDFFTTNIFEVKANQKRDYSYLDSFVIFMCVEGTAEVTVNNLTEVVTMGETILVPANTDSVEFNSQGSKLLEVFI